MTRERENICPNCYSKLLVEDGELFCSGSKLKYWTIEFGKYENFSKTEKAKYLIDMIENTDSFLYMYEKWKTEKENFSCDFVNQPFLDIFEKQNLIADPLQVKSVERKLGRKLTDLELFGEQAIVIDGSIVVIKKVNFPEDF